MLDNKTIEIIKSTVPVLQQHGETITGRFYDRMFQDHPELLNIFNQTNQKKKHSELHWQMLLLQLRQTLTN